jgi:hypothetical protein
VNLLPTSSHFISLILSYPICLAKCQQDKEKGSKKQKERRKKRMGNKAVK